MKSLLSVVIAAAFAATSFKVAAQTKDPTTKGGGEVKTKDGGVKRKEVKDKPKGGELPKVEKREKKAKAAPSEVKTKGGGEVKSKDGAVNKK